MLQSQNGHTDMLPLESWGNAAIAARALEMLVPAIVLWNWLTENAGSSVACTESEKLT
jgi:hypothetical protein